MEATFAAAADRVRPLPTEREYLAYDLFAASCFESNADARLLMAMMALETLIDPNDRDAEARQLVQSLIDQAATSALPAHERQSITGAMRWLLKESIGQAGRRLVQVLGERRYDGQTPERFFAHCYNLRSALVHGHTPRPPRLEVDRAAANLQLLVGELLGLRLLDVTQEFAEAEEARLQASASEISTHTTKAPG